MANRAQIPHLSEIRAQYGDAMASALLSLQQTMYSVADQTATNANGAVSGKPPQISGINVTEKNGIHDIQITDESPAQRGLNYFAEYSQNADMSNAHKIDLGASQNHRVNLGAGQYYWHGYSSYGSSEPSDPVFHGGVAPVAVGSGSYAGPDMQARQGGRGFGPQFRNSSVPPTRSR